MSVINKPILARDSTMNHNLETKIQETNPFQGLSLQLPTTTTTIITQKKEEPKNSSERDIQTLLELSDFTPFHIKDAQPVHFYSLNSAHEVGVLNEKMCNKNDKNDKILSIGLRVYHSGWEEEDCHDKYYLFQKVRNNELSSENKRRIQELDSFNRSKNSTFDYKEFDDSFLNKYTLISCWKENYENCQYQLFQRYYSDS